MKSVKGVVYVNGQAAFSFEADEALSYPSDDRLKLYPTGAVNPLSGNEPLAADGNALRSTPRVWDPVKGKWLDDAGAKANTAFQANPGRASRSAHLWDIEWQSANLFIKQIELQGKKSSKQFGTMNQAKGVVYKGGQIASTFQTDLAEAFETDDRLKLSGKVVLTAIEIDKKDNSKKTTVLKANEVLWDPVKERYVASGAVEVDGPNGYLAPTDKVFATAKLDKIATSEDYFKK